ncbi:hypothetical protein SELMODRAFT_407745 [Selaginella moellendorffii]|uniref:Cytochrome P450-dependent monooxygenase n=1 Tax=Selaginella moellendorffii TaxID=88036 RepID=D8R6M2_SELML|nr:hypothetical protein SELMODRAFT_407745 [Selaginella moellendorffii]
MDLLSHPILSALVLLAAALWFSSTRRRNPPGNLPPGPLNLPVIGCLHKLGSLPHISLHKLSKRYGDVMHLKLGSVPTVIIISERAAKEIFNRHGLEFASKAPLICGKYFGNDYNGNPVLLLQKIHDMNMNVIIYMLFGKRFCGHYKNTANVDEFVQAIAETVRLAGIFNVRDYIPGIRWLDVQGLEKKCKQLMNRVNRHHLSILRDRRGDPPVFTSEEPMAFIDVLISMGEKLPDTTKIQLLLPQCFIDLPDIDVFGQSFNLLPFGTGRRVCPGAKLGFDAVQMGIAMLVQGFDWKLDRILMIRQS